MSISFNHRSDITIKQVNLIIAVRVIRNSALSHFMRLDKPMCKRAIKFLDN
jgi:hypothetical protein